MIVYCMETRLLEIICTLAYKHLHAHIYLANSAQCEYLANSTQWEHSKESFGVCERSVYFPYTYNMLRHFLYHFLPSFV